MKKVLLVSIALCIGVFAMAQQNKYACKLYPKFKAYQKVADKDDGLYSMTGPVKPPHALTGNVKNTNAIASFPIGQSNNAFGVIISEATCLDANQALGMIMYTYRAKVGTDGGVTSGDIMDAYSTDNGATWTKTITAPVMNSNILHRYPSGVIYNPSGNSDPTQAYALDEGPATTAGGSPPWWGNYFVTKRLDGQLTDSNYVYLPNIPTSTAQHSNLIREGLTGCTDGSFHICAADYSLDAGSTYYAAFFGGIVKNGLWNTATNKISWTGLTVPQHFAHIAANAGAEWGGAVNNAWKKDGSVGYLYFTGVDTLATPAQYSYQPIIWTSTDHGDNWTKLPWFDFGTIPTLASHVWPTTNAIGDSIHPMFSELDGAVDYQGYLHFVAIVRGHFSNNADSLGYEFSLEPQIVYHIFQTNMGWAADSIGLALSNYVSSTNTPWGTGTDVATWDHRIQISMTEDGTKIFAVWEDTDTLAAGSNLNIAPNLIAWGKDLVTGKMTHATNFTAGTPLDGTTYMHFASDIALTNSTCYTIPCTMVVPDFASPSNAISHTYVQGVGFCDTDFIDSTATGINNTHAINTVAVSQNYPNPANGNTEIKVSLPSTSDITLQVVNTMGQKVYEINHTNMGAGSHNFVINTSKFTSGVYYYTVITADTKVTKKMIVE